MYKSIKLKNDTFWDTVSGVHRRTNLQTVIDNILAKNTSQDTSITNINNNINTINDKLGSKLGFTAALYTVGTPKVYAGFINGEHSSMTIRTTVTNSHNLFILIGEQNIRTINVAVAGGNSVSNLVGSGLSNTGTNTFKYTAIPWTKFLIISCDTLSIDY